MNDKFIKIHFDKKVFFTFLGIFIIGLATILLNRSRNENCEAVNFQIISNSFTTSDLIEFKSISDNGFKWEWDFGDKSDKKYVSNSIHQYKKDGIYKVTLKVNNTCVISKDVTIKKLVVKEILDKDLIPTIIFPEEIKAGEIIAFECTSEFANKWEWRFGESDKVDAIAAKTNYTFKKEGFHKISLIVNDNLKHVLIKEVIVFPRAQRVREDNGSSVDLIDEILVSQIPDSPDVDAPTTPIAEAEKKIVFERRDAITMLKNYAAGKIDYADLSHNFCTSNIKVIGKKNKKSNLKELLSAIRGNKIDVKNITLLKNKSTGCVKVISIDLKIKKGMFWKEF